METRAEYQTREIDPSHYYRDLVASIDDEITKATAGVMMKHIGRENAIDIADLAKEIGVDENHQDRKNFRKTRAILEILVRDYRLPVGAIAGSHLRWLCKDTYELREVVYPLRSMLDSLGDRISKLNRCILPPTGHRIEQAKQERLF